MKVAVGVSAVALLLGLIYLLIGITVARKRGYFTELTNLDNLFSTIGEVLFWPLVVAGIKITLR